MTRWTSASGELALEAGPDFVGENARDLVKGRQGIKEVLRETETAAPFLVYEFDGG